MPIIKPTVGRRVWYWPSDLQIQRLGFSADGSQPCDAGVVYVHDERRVNLAVTDHNCTPHQCRNVRLVQDGDERPAVGSEAFAEWMPYQAAQAKKQEPEQAPAGEGEAAEHRDASA